MNLYNVVHDNQHMIVAAKDFGDAQKRWLEAIRIDEDNADFDDSPESVQLIATENDIVWPESVSEAAEPSARSLPPTPSATIARYQADVLTAAVEYILDCPEEMRVSDMQAIVGLEQSLRHGRTAPLETDTTPTITLDNARTPTTPT